MPLVLVVGSGAAGLAAATSAAENGAEVMVLDRAPRRERGGNTFYTESYFRLASETELAPNFREDFVAMSGGRCDMALVETLADHAISTLSWVREMGMRLDSSLAPTYLTLTRPRLLPSGGGAAILDALERRARDLGVQFAYERTAHSLKVADGRVRGVEALDATGREESYDASSVILACGGFEGNRDMERQYMDGPVEGLHFYAPGARYNQGEGIDMALRIGAKPAGDYDKFHACLVDIRSPKHAAGYSCQAYGIMLNIQGRRFIDESVTTPDAWYEEVARAVWRQPGSQAFILLDASFFDLPNWQRTIRTDQPPIIGDTLEELVAKLPFEDPDQAMQTLRAYNESARPSRLTTPHLDGVSAIADGISKSNWAYRLENGPFRAYHAACANVFTFGGLQVTAEARVVSVEGAPIPGLFAAGETMGLYYGRYVGATSVMRGLTFGRIAGRFAALQS